jgi:hypothetical protein
MMAKALDRCDPDQAGRDCEEPRLYELGSEETELRVSFEVLHRASFRVCVRRKLGLVGWW